MKREERIKRQSEFSEKSLEKALTEEVRKMGGIALKYFNPNQAGFPDRLLLLPGLQGRVTWVEVKSKGARPTPLQEARHALLRRLGYKVYIIDSKVALRGCIEAIKGDL